VTTDKLSKINSQVKSLLTSDLGPYTLPLVELLIH